MDYNFFFELTDNDGQHFLIGILHTVAELKFRALLLMS
jgi:hypothetical protein